MALEVAAREVCHHSGEAAIAHKKVRSASHDHEGDVFIEAMPHEVGEALFTLGFNPELGWSTDAHCRVLGKWLVKFDAPRAHHALQGVAHFEILRETLARLVDVSRAEAQDEVAILCHGCGGFVNAGNLGHMRCGGMSGGVHGINNRLAGNAGNRFFAGRVDVRNKNMIR